MASIPPAPTLSIAAGDTVNYKGAPKVVSSVAAGSDNSKGLITYAVTLVGGTVITLSANDTVKQSANNSFVGLWSQSAV